MAAAGLPAASGPSPKPAAAHPRFTVADLGPIPQIASDVMPALSADGRAVIWRETSSGTYAPLLWNRGRSRSLGVPAGFTNAFAYSLNRRGIAAGWANTTANPVDSLARTHACLWTGTSWTDLGTLGGKDSRAYAVDDAGIVVGVSDLPGGAKRGFRYARGVMEMLQPLPGGSFSIAFDVNQAGVAVGAAAFQPPGRPRPLVHAALWRASEPIDIGAGDASAASTACAIDDHDDVVGVVQRPSGQSVFLYTAGRMHDLGIDGRPFGINDRLQIVGTREGPEGGRDAGFLWDGGRLWDLNACVPVSAGFQIVAAYRINGVGQIVCAGMHAGQLHALLLTAAR